MCDYQLLCGVDLGEIRSPLTLTTNEAKMRRVMRGG